MKIGLDLDNTLAYVDDAWADYFATKAEEHGHSRSLKPGAPNYGEAGDICQECKTRCCEDPEILLKGRVYRGSSAVVSAMRCAGHEFYVVSHRGPALEDAIRQLLTPTGLIYNIRAIHLGFAPKSDTARALGLDWMVDDNPAVLGDLQSAGFKTITFAQIYNTHVPGPRAKDWLEVHYHLVTGEPHV